jgi:hypothetical protein
MLISLGSDLRTWASEAMARAVPSSCDCLAAAVYCGHGQPRAFEWYSKQEAVCVQ